MRRFFCLVATVVMGTGCGAPVKVGADADVPGFARVRAQVEVGGERTAELEAEVRRLRQELEAVKGLLQAQMDRERSSSSSPWHAGDFWSAADAIVRQKLGEILGVPALWPSILHGVDKLRTNANELCLVVNRIEDVRRRDFPFIPAVRVQLAHCPAVPTGPVAASGPGPRG